MTSTSLDRAADLIVVKAGLLGPEPLLALIALVFLVTFLLRWMGGRRERARWRGLAGELGRRLENDSPLTLRGDFEGFPVKVVQRQGLRKSGTSASRRYLELELRTRRPVPAGLFVAGQGRFQSSVDRMFGVSQVRVGVPDIDDALFIKADDAQGAAELFRLPPVSEAVMRLTHKFEGATIKHGSVPDAADAIRMAFDQTTSPSAHTCGDLTVMLDVHTADASTLRTHLRELSLVARALDAAASA